MRHLIFLLFCSIPYFGTAQQPLKTGDKLPSFVAGNFLNWDKSTLTSDQFKGKMLLLDFASTTCSPCVAIMPLLDSLQKQFKEAMQVLMIMRENKEQVKRFMQTNKIARQITFPVITNDSQLNKWFPHGEIPHEIWINPNGIIVGMTDHHYLTGSHIELILQGRKPDWPVKADALSGTNDRTIKRFLPLESTQYYTLSSKHILGYRPGGFFIVDSVKDKFYMRQINETIRNLYNDAFRAGGLQFNTATTKIDSSVVDAYSYNGKGFQAEWDERNRYCFEMLAPLPQQREELAWKIIRELDSYFGIRTSTSKQPWKCIVLKKMEGNYYPSNFQDGSNRTSLRNIIFSLAQHGTKVVINETGISKDKLSGIFINIKYQQLGDRNLLEEKLQRAGFCLLEEERLMEVVELKPARKKQ